MSWKNLINSGTVERLTVPWVGGDIVYANDRQWKIEGRKPKHDGWHEFEVSTNGLHAEYVGAGERDITFGQGLPTASGYLVGSKMIFEGARAGSPEKIITDAVDVHCVQRGTKELSLILALGLPNQKYVFKYSQHTPPIAGKVYERYLNRQSIGDLKGVSPALEASFTWSNYFRDQQEQMAREARERLDAERLRKEMTEHMGTAHGRREISQDHFEVAARSALQAGGADLIDFREAPGEGEMIVRYSVDGERIECICDAITLRIIDSGVCLTDHRSGVAYDNRLTLESLPSVIREAVALGKLVVWRHA